MGFNRRKMEDERRRSAEKAGRRAADAQVLEDAERLIGAWNERQAKRMPMLFSPTIGAAISALLVPVGTLPGVSDDKCDRSTPDRSSPRRDCDQPHSRAVLPILPAECTVC